MLYIIYLFSERIGGTNAQGAVLIEIAKLLPQLFLRRSLPGSWNSAKDIALTAQLLVGLNGGKEMGMLIVDGATATVEKYGRQAEPMSKIQDWRCLEGHEVVVVGRGLDV